MPIRLRIALLGALVVLLTVVGYSVLIYRAVAGGLGPNQDQQLVQLSQRVLAFVEGAPAEALASRQPFAPIDLAYSTESFVVLLDTSGAPVASTALIGGAPPHISQSVLETARQQGGVTLTVQDAPGVPVRLHVRTWSRPDLDRDGYLVVGQSTRATEAQVQGIRAFIQFSAVVTLAAALIAIWIVAGRALQPLRLVARTAEDIRLSGDLGRRLPEQTGHDELGQLARSFNGMLSGLQQAQERLTAALEAQRRFVADASHELRTPLTTIRSNAGLLMRRADLSADDRQAALADIASESERMSRLVQDLLTLARADAGLHLVRGPLQLDALAAEVGRQARQMLSTSARNVALELEPETRVCGDPDALKQLLWILLDNAGRFTPDGGRIELQVCRDGTKARLSVADDGPGIRETDLERIFERFYQADASRAGTGAGLGLSIARWIAQEHGGQLCASNRPEGGAIFTLDLPLLANS